MANQVSQEDLLLLLQRRPVIACVWKESFTDDEESFTDDVLLPILSCTSVLVLHVQDVALSEACLAVILQALQSNRLNSVRTQYTL